MKSFKNGFLTTLGVLFGIGVFGAIGEWAKEYNEKKTKEVGDEETKNE